MPMVLPCDCWCGCSFQNRDLLAKHLQYREEVLRKRGDDAPVDRTYVKDWDCKHGIGRCVGAACVSVAEGPVARGLRVCV